MKYLYLLLAIVIVIAACKKENITKSQQVVPNNLYTQILGTYNGIVFTHDITIDSTYSDTVTLYVNSVQNDSNKVMITGNHGYLTYIGGLEIVLNPDFTLGNTSDYSSGKFYANDSLYLHVIDSHHTFYEWFFYTKKQ